MSNLSDISDVPIDPELVALEIGPVAYVIVKGDDDVWVNRYQNAMRRDEKLPTRLAKQVVTILRWGYSLQRKGKNGPTVMWQNGENK